MEKINWVIDQIAQFEIKKILITGGEPTLRPKLPEIIRHLTNHDIDVLLTTNAYSMSDKLAKKLRDSGLKELQVKLDTTDPEKQDKLSGVMGSYKKLIQGIITLKKQSSFKVSIASVATSLNISDIPEVIKLGADLGIKDFRPPIYTSGIWELQGRGGSWLNPSCDSILWLEEKIKQLQETYKDNLTISPIYSYTYHKKKQNEVPVCPGFTSCCAILENGSVVPCEVLADFSEDFVIGSLNKETLIEIWNSEKAIRWARREYPIIGEPCSSCDGFKRCNGECPWKAYAAYGQWLADPYCIKAPSCTKISFPTFQKKLKIH